MDRRSFIGTCPSGLVTVRSVVEAQPVVDGRNLTFDGRYADVRLERLPDLAAQLVRLRVNAIGTGSNPYVALPSARPRQFPSSLLIQ